MRMPLLKFAEDNAGCELVKDHDWILERNTPDEPHIVTLLTYHGGDLEEGVTLTITVPTFGSNESIPSQPLHIMLALPFQSVIYKVIDWDNGSDSLEILLAKGVAEGLAEIQGELL